MSVLPIEEKDIENTEIVCRYCLDSSKNGKKNPCNCKNFVHRECLRKWLAIKKNNTCEICKIEYKNMNIDLQFQLFSSRLDDFIKIILCRFQHWSPRHYNNMQLQISLFLLLCIIIFIIYLSITCLLDNKCGSFKGSPTDEPTFLPTNS